MSKRSLAVFSAILLSVSLFAGIAAAGTPEERVAAYHQALLDGDIDAAKSMLGEDLVLYEDGTPEKSMETYAKGHLKVPYAVSGNHDP